MITRKPASHLALALLASVLIVSAPGVAAPAPPAPPATVQPPAPTAPLLAGVTAGCGQAGLAADIGVATQPTALAGPACTLSVGDGVLGAKPFHGFCRCSCTFTPDCNTSADCGGSPCLHAITCCAAGR